MSEIKNPGSAGASECLTTNFESSFETSKGRLVVLCTVKDAADFREPQQGGVDEPGASAGSRSPRPTKKARIDEEGKGVERRDEAQQAAFDFFLAFECFKTGKFTFNNYTFMDTSACIGKAYEVTIHKDDLIDIHNVFSIDHTIAMDVLKSRPNRVEVTDDVVSLGTLLVIYCLIMVELPFSFLRLRSQGLKCSLVTQINFHV
jgi:hypothetical protein